MKTISVGHDYEPGVKERPFVFIRLLFTKPKNNREKEREENFEDSTLNNLKQDMSSICVGNEETIVESALVKRITKVSLNDGWAENAGSLIFSKRYMDTKRKRRKRTIELQSVNEL